jgi:hypothetical protein
MITDLCFTLCCNFALIAYSASQRYEKARQNVNKDEAWNRYISHRYTIVLYVWGNWKKKKMTCKAKRFLPKVFNNRRQKAVFDIVTLCCRISSTSSLQMQRVTVATDCTQWHTYTHTHTRTHTHLVGLPWTRGRRDLYLYNSQNIQKTNTHAAAGFETVVPANCAAVDRRLRRRGHRDRQEFYWSGAK